MYLLVDEMGIIHGNTPVKALVKPLKAALESVLGCSITIVRKTQDGNYKMEG